MTRDAREAARVERIYRDRLPPAYGDPPGTNPIRRLTRRLSWHTWRVAYDFEGTARAAIDALTLSTGDRVVVFCCGAGREFAQLRELVGAEGTVVGIDFSPTMLAIAREGIARAGWQNVHLARADVTRRTFATPGRFDAAVCLNGLSVIPDASTAYARLAACVREGGDIAVGDLTSTRGWRALANPIIAAMARPYGGSRQGHARAADIFRRMERELDMLRTGTSSWGTYRFVVGRT